MFGRLLVLAVLGTINVSLCWDSVSAQRRNAADIELDEESYSISMKACYVEDLRNIREYSQRPLTVLINHCYLQELPNAIFIRFADLHTLEISDSRLNNLQDFALNGLRNLEVLNFSRNNLTTIKSWSDHDLEHLHTLDLRRNLLKAINAESFRRYPNLTKLNLAVNLIQSVPEGTFKVVPNLKHLNLGRNQLTSIEETTLKGLSKLTHVSFHHNQITFVDFFAFVGNSHLKMLQLQGNQISVFETDLLSNLPRLAFLNVSHNQLDNLAENTFKRNADLRLLDLSYNNIEVLHEDSLKGLVSLEVIKHTHVLNHKFIAVLWAAMCKHLTATLSHVFSFILTQVFNASHNQLNKLNKYMFKDFSAVRVLDLSANRLAYVENKLFEYSTRLEILNLSRNAITEVEQNIFEDCRKMHTLDLSHNQLKEDAFLWPIIDLRHLNMSHNKFQQLNTSFLESVEQVELYGNPWSCRFLVLELMKHGKNVRYGRNYVVQTRDSILNAQGIECTDEGGKLRDFVVVESAPKADYSSSVSCSRHMC